MVIDDIAVDQSLHVELLLEDGHHKSITLRRFELLVLLASSILEFQSLVLVLKLNFQALIFRFFVQLFVREKNKNQDLLQWICSSPVLTCFEIESFKLIIENLLTLSCCDKDIVCLLGSLRRWVEL